MHIILIDYVVNLLDFVLLHLAQDSEEDHIPYAFLNIEYIFS